MNLGAMWEGIKFSGLAMSMVFLVLALLGVIIEVMRLLLHRPGAANAAPSGNTGTAQGAAGRPPAQAAGGAREAAAPPAAAVAAIAAAAVHSGAQGASSPQSKLALVAAIAAAFHQSQGRQAPALPVVRSAAGGAVELWKMRARRSGLGTSKRNRRWNNG